MEQNIYIMTLILPELFFNIQKKERLTLSIGIEWVLHWIHSEPLQMFVPGLFSVPIILPEQEEKSHREEKPSTDFLHKHREKSSYNSSFKVGDPPGIFSMACVFS